ncbi:MAG: ABC transporter substrate-binding protein, partial [Cucumibacter sp.]
MTDLIKGPSQKGGINRRRLLQTGAGAAAAVTIGSLAAPAIRAQSAIKIGYVSPQSGPLAAFAEADNFIVSTMTQLIGAGIETAGGTMPVEILVRDSQSNPNLAADVTRDLIVDDGVSLIVVASTPETTNPVSTQCEIEEMPCVST